METTQDKIRKLIDKSELSLLAEQVWQQHKTILFLEERVSAFERLIASYARVTMDLAKEVKVGVGIQGLKTKSGKYGRSSEEVAKRWAEWRRLEEQGMTPAQVARRWGVDRGTVEYARSKGYTQKPTAISGRNLRLVA
ncbi:MAG: hypothetical protein EBS60_06200 [Verrucomicrobia bacterium]|nr:hypothetical protein [Verrucomicrobiota bacterium]